MRKEAKIKCEVGERKGKRCQLTGTGRKVKFPKVEQEDTKSLVSRREQKLSVLCKRLASYALEFFQETVNQGEAKEGEFKASNGWMQEVYGPQQAFCSKS